MRRAPVPEPTPAIRINSVHQGDLEGCQGRYPIHAVDGAAPWEGLASVHTISEAHLLALIGHMLDAFSFTLA